MSFQREKYSILGIPGALYSSLYTVECLHGTFNNPEAVLAASAVLKQGTRSFITDVIENFANELNKRVLKSCAFKTCFATFHHL